MHALRRFYGAHPLHLFAVVASFAVVGYVISVLGPKSLWNTQIWWQSIVVWFLGAIIAHDLILFPLYALADRSLSAGWQVVTRRLPASNPTVSPVNYLRIPALASGLLLLMFFPGIIEQGESAYLAATGQTQQPFLGRWLLLVAVLFGVSAIAYAIRVGFARNTTSETPAVTDDEGAAANSEESR